MASGRLLSCPAVPRRGTFSSPTLAVHQLPRSETGTFPCKMLFGGAWGEVCSEERQRLHFRKDFFPPPLFQVDPGKAEHVPGKATCSVCCCCRLFCLLSHHLQSSLLHPAEPSLPQVLLASSPAGLRRTAMKTPRLLLPAGCPAPLLSPSRTQLTLPRARLRRTSAIKCMLGAQRNENRKTHAPRHQFIFTLATLSGISRSCSHLLNLYEILAGWRVFRTTYPRQQG